jgi:hypothetical protein
MKETWKARVLKHGEPSAAEGDMFRTAAIRRLAPICPHQSRKTLERRFKDQLRTKLCDGDLAGQWDDRLPAQQKPWKGLSRLARDRSQEAHPDRSWSIGTLGVSDV